MPQAPFLPASQGAQQASLPSSNWRSALASGNNVQRPAQAWFSNCTNKATPRQAGLWARQRAILAEAPHERLFPKRSPSGTITRPSRQRLCDELRAARFPTDPSVGTLHLAFGNSLTELVSCQKERWDDLNHPPANRFSNGVPSE